MRNSGWTFVLTIFVLSRLFFFGVGIAAVTYLPPGKPPFFEGGKEVPARGFLDSWANFDGGWYLGIASSGYDLDNPASTAFFPLFPMLIRLGAALGGKPAIWGVLVSLVATFFALYFLYRIAEKHLGLKVARATVLTFAFFPTAFFLNAVYTEALFVALSAGSCWAAAVRRDLLLAGVLGALAAATRNLGVLLLIPLGFEWLYSRREFGWWRALSIGIVPAGLVGYMTFLWARFGDPFITIKQQSAYWGREFTYPLTTLRGAWTAAGVGMRHMLDDPTSLFFDQRFYGAAFHASRTVDLAFLVLFVIVMGVGFAVLPERLMGLWLYAFLIALVPLLWSGGWSPLMGLPRYVLDAFPLFFILGYLLSHSRPALYLWLFVSGGLGAVLAALFVTGRWVA
jgi:hypothetical protein